MLASIYLNDEPPIEANEVKNGFLKRNLAPKLELRQPATTQQSPHCTFGICPFVPHSLCEVSDPIGDRSVVDVLCH